MSAISLNLLPPAYKNVIRREELRRTIRFFTAVVLGVVAVGMTLLLPSYLPLLLQQNELRRSLDIEKQAVGIFGLEETIKEMRAFSSRLTGMRGALRRPPVASRLVSDILAFGTDGVMIYGVAIGEDGSVDMTGFAARRSDLIGMEERMRASGQFSDVTLPLATIVRQTDIEFSLHATLAPEFRLSAGEKID
ncbi:MAG: hypothetical protein AAB539_03405 [Patescibacteria group bacterium]